MKPRVFIIRFSQQSRRREWQEFKLILAELRRAVYNPETPREHYHVLKQLFHDEFNTARAKQDLLPRMTETEWQSLSKALRGFRSGVTPHAYQVALKAWNRRVKYGDNHD